MQREKKEGNRLLLLNWPRLTADRGLWAEEEASK